MNKCFIYCRQSSGESNPEESLSINVQTQECERLAESKNLKVVGIFKDGDLSGRLYPVGFEQLAAIDTAYCRWCEETRKTGQFRTQLGLLLQQLELVDYYMQE